MEVIKEDQPEESKPEEPLKLKCPTCANILSFNNPDIRIFNHPMVTTILLVNHSGVRCSKCNGYSYLIGALDGPMILLIPAPAAPPKTAPLVTEAKGIKIPNIRGGGRRN